MLTANDKLIAVQYDEQLSTESLEALAKLRVEKLKVFLHGDVRFDWGKFKALKSLKIRVRHEHYHNENTGPNNMNHRLTARLINKRCSSS